VFCPSSEVSRGGGRFFLLLPFLVEDAMVFGLLDISLE
jgi:hypothetical protein